MVPLSGRYLSVTFSSEYVVFPATYTGHSLSSSKILSLPSVIKPSPKYVFTACSILSSFTYIIKALVVPTSLSSTIS